MAKTGRPTDYTEALADVICDRVTTRPMFQVAQDDDMPDEATIYRWLGRHDYFREKYRACRSIRAYMRNERVDQVMLDMRSGVIDAAMARVELDAIKWQAGRENAPVFGDKTALVGANDGPLQIQYEELTTEQLKAKALALLNQYPELKG